MYRLRPPTPLTQEDALHSVARCVLDAHGVADFLLIFASLAARGDGAGRERLRRLLGDARTQRQIGVIYRPDTERLSHFVLTRVVEQVDAMAHFDVTTALLPLDRPPVWEESAAQQGIAK